MKQQDAKGWFQRCMISVLTAILFVFFLVWLFDPYFHFHKPFPFVSYRLLDERYCNDGISRHFDYDAIITGTSMAQNYKTTELNALFGVKAVKETFSGSGYREQSDNLRRALEKNEDLKTVFWSMDYNALIREKDYDAYEGYPLYLYDENPWNDVSYVFNKSVLYHGVMTNMIMTLTGQESTSMDEYSSWEKEMGYDYIMSAYDRWEVGIDSLGGLTQADRSMITANIQQNFIDLVRDYPNTVFYIFYTPYSIYYWDFLNQEGMMEMQLEAEQIATELLLQCPNVKLYNFNDQYDIIGNPDNYRDKEHYGAHINSKILQWIVQDIGRVTVDNYMEKLQTERDYYMQFDYSSIFR